MHKSIRFKNLGLSFQHKQWFYGFSEEVLYGSRIAIIGRNSIGKATLKIIDIEIAYLIHQERIEWMLSLKEIK